MLSMEIFSDFTLFFKRKKRTGIFFPKIPVLKAGLQGFEP